MAKTIFSTGTIVTRHWLNAVYGTTGHIHDGQNEDGHAPKITPTELDGIIPVSKLQQPPLYIYGLDIYTGYAYGDYLYVVVNPGICSGIDSVHHIQLTAVLKKRIRNSSLNFVEWEAGDDKGCVGIDGNGDLLDCSVGWYRLFAVKNSSTNNVDIVLTTFADSDGQYVQNVLIQNNWNINDIVLRRIGFVNIYEESHKHLRVQYQKNGHVYQESYASAVSIANGVEDVTVDLPDLPNLPALINVRHYPSTNGWALWNRFNYDGNINRTRILMIDASYDHDYQSGCISSNQKISIYNYEVGSSNYTVDAVGYYDDRLS